jgi:hypothetical protein
MVRPMGVEVGMGGGGGICEGDMHNRVLWKQSTEDNLRNDAVQQVEWG